MGFIFVALGGAIGSLCRYSISLIPVKTAFPLLTLIINIIGTFLIGFIVGIINDKDNVPPDMVLFWKVGFCGGFTAFSAFSLEAYTMLERKEFLQGGMYICLSIGCCLLGVMFGKKLSLLFR